MENLKLKRAITDSSLESGPMRGGFSRYIGPGPGEPRRGVCESLKGPISLAIDVLFRFLGVFSTIFSLFRKIIMLNSLRLLNYVCYCFVYRICYLDIQLQKK